MKDWTLLAKASGLKIPDQDLQRIAPLLTALDQAFRPLTAGLAPEMEPAAIFNANEENS